MSASIGFSRASCAAHFDADLVNVAIGDVAVGTREINVFENAKRAALVCSGKAWMLRKPFLSMMTISPGSHVADEFGVDQIEGAGFAGQDPGVTDLADGERAKPDRDRGRRSIRARVMITSE